MAVTGWAKSTYSSHANGCVEWRTSTHSMQQSNCVQVAPSVQVRDSKTGDASPVITFSPAAWRAFTARLKAA